MHANGQSMSVLLLLLFVNANSTDSACKCEYSHVLNGPVSRGKLLPKSNQNESRVSVKNQLHMV